MSVFNIYNVYFILIKISLLEHEIIIMIKLLVEVIRRYYLITCKGFGMLFDLSLFIFQEEIL